MAINQKELRIRLTPAQHKAITDVIETSDLTQAQWLRQAVGQAVTAQKGEWVDDYPQHGGKRVSKEIED